jgi:hypothetical protein
MGYYAANSGNFLQRNNPEELSSQLLRCGSLKSRMLAQYKLPYVKKNK